MIRHTIYRRGKWWWIRYTWDGALHRVPLRTASKRDAEALAKIHLQKIIQGALPTVSIGQLIVRFLNMGRVEKRSWKSDKSLARAVLEHFGPSKPLNEIKALDVQQFKIAMSQMVGRRGQLSHATVNRHLALLKSMFNRAIEWEMYDKPNPCAKVKLYQESSHAEYFTPDEISRLLNAARQISETGTSDIRRYFLYILTTGIMTGMRLGEILKMRWSEIADSFITVRAESAKSKRQRQVPVAPELLQALIKLPSVGGDLVFPVRRSLEDMKLGRPPSGPASSDAIAKVWRRCKAMAGVRPEARFHLTRHTLASMMIQRGVDIVTVKEILGHSDIKLTQIYSHSSQEKKALAVGRIWDKKPLKLGATKHKKNADYGR